MIGAMAYLRNERSRLKFGDWSPDYLLM